MQKRVSRKKANRAWWQVHIEAWQKSGLSVTRYCAVHGLTTKSFNIWRREIAVWEDEKELQRQKDRKRRRPISPEMRAKAKQAFWAMHVEAWVWSGLPLAAYARTHQLAEYSLKRWRNMIENHEFEIDWRTMLHPSSLPLISNKISTSAKEKPPYPLLTKAIDADLPDEARCMAEAIEAAEPPREKKRRRRFTTEQKIAILLEVERHGESMNSVSRAYGLSPSLLWRWRDKYGVGKEKPAVMVPVRVLDAPGAQTAPQHALIGKLPCPDGMQEIVLDDGRSVFAPLGADPEAVNRAVAEQENRQ